MRGALVGADDGGEIAGIIPAYAGSTKSLPTSSQPSEDHPRVCGEHFRIPADEQVVAGSSPRMRGALGDLAGAGASGRIIPAYAGSTEFPDRFSYPARDHPRVCGEHSSISRMLSIGYGSSPRMRGALYSENGYAKIKRIIPAYAGSTVPVSRTGRRCKDHPRVCGEHFGVKPG